MILNLIQGMSQNLEGSASGNYSLANVSIINTLDSGSYNCRYSYDIGFTANLPILLLMNGWGSNNTSFTDATLNRFASKGYFVIAVSDKQGLTYSGGKNIHIVKDVIDYIRTNNSRASKRKAVISGYSAGGGFTLNAIGCFPELFIGAIDNFGMSDYGYDNVTSWWVTNTGFQSDLNTIIGTRSTHLADYYARNARLAVNNFAGKLFIFHDSADSSVNIAHTNELSSLLSIDRLINISNVVDSPRWLHEYPNGTNQIIQAEQYWDNYVFGIPSKSLPLIGSLIVHNGFVTTNNFHVKLNNYDMLHVAELNYNLQTKVFSIKSLTGSQTIEITYGSQTISHAVDNTFVEFNF